MPDVGSGARFSDASHELSAAVRLTGRVICLRRIGGSHGGCCAGSQEVAGRLERGGRRVARSDRRRAGYKGSRGDWRVRRGEFVVVRCLAERSGGRWEGQGWCWERRRPPSSCLPSGDWPARPTRVRASGRQGARATAPAATAPKPSPLLGPHRDQTQTRPSARRLRVSMRPP